MVGIATSILKFELGLLNLIDDGVISKREGYIIMEELGETLDDYVNKRKEKYTVKDAKVHICQLVL